MLIQERSLKFERLIINQSERIDLGSSSLFLMAGFMIKINFLLKILLNNIDMPLGFFGCSYSIDL